MRLIFRLALFTMICILGGVAFIRYVYGTTWAEAFDIADQFVDDLLA